MSRAITSTAPSAKAIQLSMRKCWTQRRVIREWVAVRRKMSDSTFAKALMALTREGIAQRDRQDYRLAIYEKPGT